MDNAFPVGQNVKRLISMLMAKEAIPDGGGFKDGVRSEERRVGKECRL